MAPLVSIVLPVFNGERYLKKAIESTLSQEFRDFELIVWDDASTDRSHEIIQGYSDQRIRVFKNDSNRGLFATLNVAIKETKAPWIRLWCQDDIMKSNCLGVEVEHCESYPQAGMGICSYSAVNERDEVVTVPEPLNVDRFVSKEAINQIFFYMGCVPRTISTVVLRKSAIEDVGMFSESMRIAGDFDLWVRLARKYPAFFIKEKLVFVRSHSEQLSGRRDSYIICMREEKAIYEELLTRLPEEIRGYAERYHRLSRDSRFIHHLIRSLFRGDFESARASFAEIRKLDDAIPVAAYWLFTANQNIFKMKPKYLLGSGSITSDFRKLVFASTPAN